MKKFIVGILTLAMMLTSAIIVYAATDFWSYSDYSNGSYVPKYGTMKSSYSSGYANTKVEFELDSNNVTAIIDYNNGNNSTYPNKKGFLTVDITSVRDGDEDYMDAYAISSNLPNPKFDMENDDWFGDNHDEESETVALGKVKANKSYYMATKWIDLRNGNSGESGTWQCQFSMSKKGWSDYNTFVQSSQIQASIDYGDDAGQD